MEQQAPQNNDNSTPAQNQSYQSNPLPSTTPSTNPNPQPAPTSTPPPIQSSRSPWPWILGGCLILILITIIAFGLVIWWGIKTADKHLDKFEPAIENLNGTMETMNKESEKWEKESQKILESFPSEEELPQEYQN